MNTSVYKLYTWY